MKYFIDFDRTLFATDAFNATLPDEPACAPFSEELRKVLAKGRDDSHTGGEERVALWKKLNDAAAEGRISFPPGYLARFVYPDVLPSLAALGERAVIITFGNVAWQKAKVESALALAYPTAVHYVGNAFKVEAFAREEGFLEESSVLIDDRVAELDAVASAFPGMRLVEMRRDGREGDGRWPVIRSLEELPPFA